MPFNIFTILEAGEKNIKGEKEIILAQADAMQCKSRHILAGHKSSDKTHRVCFRRWKDGTGLTFLKGSQPPARSASMH